MRSYFRIQLRELWPLGAIVVAGLSLLGFTDDFWTMVARPHGDAFLPTWIFACAAIGAIVGFLHGARDEAQGTLDYRRHRGLPIAAMARLDLAAACLWAAVWITVPVGVLMLSALIADGPDRVFFGWAPIAVALGTVTFAALAIAWWAAAGGAAMLVLAGAALLAWMVLSFELTKAPPGEAYAPLGLYVAVQLAVTAVAAWLGVGSHARGYDPDQPLLGRGACAQRLGVLALLGLVLVVTIPATQAGLFRLDGFRILIERHGELRTAGWGDARERVVFSPSEHAWERGLRSARGRSSSFAEGSRTALRPPLAQGRRWDGPAYYSPEEGALWVRDRASADADVSWRRLQPRERALASAVDLIRRPDDDPARALLAEFGEPRLWELHRGFELRAVPLGEPYVGHLFAGDRLYLFGSRSVWERVGGELEALSEGRAAIHRQVFEQKDGPYRIEARYRDPAHLDVLVFEPEKAAAQAFPLVLRGYERTGWAAALSLLRPPLLQLLSVFPRSGDDLGLGTFRHAWLRDPLARGPLGWWLVGGSLLLSALLALCLRARAQRIGLPQRWRRRWLLATLCFGPAALGAALIVDRRRGWLPAEVPRPQEA